MSTRLQDLAARKLPEIEAALSRTWAIRDWLRAAERCACVSVDECALFDPDEIASKRPAI